MSNPFAWRPVFNFEACKGEELIAFSYAKMNARNNQGLVKRKQFFK
jgi:hypothetical protein